VKLATVGAVAATLLATTGLSLLGGRGGERRPAGGVGSRVFVVERETRSLAVYDLARREVLPRRIEGFGDLRHAVMTFSRDLRWGYVATRSGKLSRIDLERLERAGDVEVSRNSIDIAVSQDGRWIATAEYAPGGVTILDADTLEVAARVPAPARVTGIVDAPGNRFVCVVIETGEIWVIDASKPGFPVEHRIRAASGEPYDAMITPDGRFYVVGHLHTDHVSLLDLEHPEHGARTVLLGDAGELYERDTPAKLPHLASWAVAQGRVFVPLVGEERLAVLDRHTWTYQGSVPLRGHPVYAVRSPSEREVWVSFSGEEDDRFIQVIDTATLAVKRTIEVGRRIYHMDFTPRGSHLVASANKDDRLVLVDATTYEIIDVEPLRSPSGVFGPWRAFTIGL
jgi:protein NirF